jgi:hypothetical protein
MAYATLEELAEYLDIPVTELEPGSGKLLEAASVLVDMCTLGKINTSNSNHVEAAKIAVCAQVEYWQETGDSIGVLEQYESMSLGSFSVSRGGGDTTSSTRYLALAPRAYQVLFMEGLLYCGVDTK